MAEGRIKRNTRWCVRCEDEPAQPPTASVFALGGFCLNEVFVEYRIADHTMRDENGTHRGYMELIEKYGYRAV